MTNSAIPFFSDPAAREEAVKQADSFLKMYKETKEIYEERSVLEFAVKSIQSEIKKLESQLNEVKAKLGPTQEKLFAAQETYHKKALVFVTQAKDYYDLLKIRADVFLEEAKKIKTQAQNEKQEADDILTKAQKRLNAKTV